MFSKIITYIKSILLKLIYLFFRFFPLNSKMIILASERDYSDNSWALYQYIYNKYPNYRFIWATLIKKTYDNNSRTKFVYHPYWFTIKSMWYIARAKYIFYTHGLGGNLKIRKGQLVMNLWHGIAIKGTKGGIETSENKKPLFTHLIYLGDKNKKTQAQFLRCDEKYLIPLGYPRNDLMLNNRSEGCLNPFVPANFTGKVIIWMPTFRKSISKNLSEDSCETQTGLPLFNNINEIQQLNEYLVSINVCILVKIHHLQAINQVFQLNFSNIIFITDNVLEKQNLQLYQIVGKSDALLTDYSSISIDYLLLDQPIGYILDDLEEYEKNRGAFLFDNVKEVFAGTHIYNKEHLYAFLNEISKGRFI